MRELANGYCSCGRSLPCDRVSEHGVIPILVILAGAGVGVVIDQLVNNGEIGATLFNAFFAAIQALADAVFAAVDGLVSTLPMADELDFEVPGGVIQGYALVNAFFPLDLALQLSGIYIATLLVIFAFRLAVLVYHLIPKPLMGT